MSTVAIENALMTAVRAATGLTKARWAQQGAKRQEPGPFLSLQIQGPRVVGRDSVRSETDLEQDAGEEIALIAGGLRELSLTVTAFDGTFVESGTATTQMTARSLLANLQAGIRLPSVLDGLDAAGLGLIDVGPIQDIGALLGPNFESRAQVTVRFYYSHERIERTGYIETVELSKVE
jgi:hypothetical protein